VVTRPFPTRNDRARLHTSRALRYTIYSCPKKPAASAKHAEPFVKLSTRGATRLQTRHPWVYRSDIVESAVGSKSPAPGSSSASSIARQIPGQRALQFFVADRHPHDLARLGRRSARARRERIRAAIAYRKELVSNTDAYRIVFSEADFLPGLIVDRYNDVISLQILTQAMDAKPVRQAIVDTLRQEAELRPAGIVERVKPVSANWNNCRRLPRDCCGERRVRPRSE